MKFGVCISSNPHGQMVEGNKFHGTDILATAPSMAMHSIYGQWRDSGTGSVSETDSNPESSRFHPQTTVVGAHHGQASCHVSFSQTEAATVCTGPASEYSSDPRVTSDTRAGPFVCPDLSQQVATTGRPSRTMVCQILRSVLASWVEATSCRFAVTASS